MTEFSNKHESIKPPEVFNSFLTDCVLAEIKDERLHQFELWGNQEHPPHVWLTILAEKFGEAAKAILTFTTGPVTPDEKLEHELIQVAAVATAWIEHLATERIRAAQGAIDVVAKADPNWTFPLQGSVQEEGGSGR